MKIGLIIYSLTGNTRSVAERLHKKITAAGHDVTIEEITITGNTPAQPGKFKFDRVPSTENYDAVIFGAPVQALTLHPVMKTYLEKLPAMSGKKTAIFVTKKLPLLSIGGTGAVSIMKKACEAKGSKVAAAEIVVWTEKKREKTITNCVKKISAVF